MNSLKRFRAALEGNVPDVLPVAPMINVPHASRVLGVKPWEYITDNKLYVKGQLTAQKKYGYDWIFNHQPIQGITSEERKAMRIENGFVYLPTELGTVLKIPLEGGPAVKEPALKDYKDLDKLKIPDIEKKERWEPLQELLRLTKNEVYVCSKVPAPFHYAAEWMRGMDNFMLDIVTRPQDVHRLLDFMADVAIAMGKKQIELGTHGIMIEDPSAAANVISPKHYKEFAYPYEKKVCKALEKYGGEIIIHICGNTSPILKDLATTGAKCLSIDDTTNLGEAVEKVGGRTAIFGNLSVAILHKGTKKQIEGNVKSCIDTAGKQGYIVSSSCGLHAETPFDNLYTMVKASRRYGK